MTNTPIIVTGMHRSGTSMTAMLLAQHGVEMGSRLIPGNRHNRRGYFEDADFVKLQRSMVAEATAGGVRGWPDWGYTKADRRQHFAYIMAKHFELYQRHFFQVALERAACKRRLDTRLSQWIIPYIRRLSNWLSRSMHK